MKATFTREELEALPRIKIRKLSAELGITAPTKARTIEAILAAQEPVQATAQEEPAPASVQAPSNTVGIESAEPTSAPVVLMSEALPAGAMMGMGGEMKSCSVCLNTIKPEAWGKSGMCVDCEAAASEVSEEDIQDNTSAPIEDVVEALAPEQDPSHPASEGTWKRTNDSRVCPDCLGSGMFDYEECSTCEGSGFILREEESSPIPANGSGFQVEEASAITFTIGSLREHEAKRNAEGKALKFFPTTEEEVEQVEKKMETEVIDLPERLKRPSKEAPQETQSPQSEATPSQVEFIGICTLEASGMTQLSTVQFDTLLHYLPDEFTGANKKRKPSKRKGKGGISRAELFIVCLEKGGVSIEQIKAGWFQESGVAEADDPKCEETLRNYLRMIQAGTWNRKGLKGVKVKVEEWLNGTLNITEQDPPGAFTAYCEKVRERLENKNGAGYVEALLNRIAQ